MAVSINGTSGVSGVDGSAGTPALQGSDTNTGISFGTDEVAINTGGTERVKIDSSGNVGIGTSTPTELLHLAGATNPAITLQDTTNDTDARIKTNNNGDLVFEADYNSEAADSRIGFEVDGSERMRVDSNGAVHIFDNLRPWTDNSVSNGTASKRWSVIYAGTGTINTSDANLKQDIANLEQAELNVAVAIKRLIKKFRFADAVADKGDDARIHVGVIAQEVEQVFIDEGLDPHRYGLFCEDTLEDGNKRLGIRYDELLAFVIAALLEGGAS